MGSIELLSLLVAAGANVNGDATLGNPLRVAIKARALDEAAWLLEHGADVNGRPSPKESTRAAEIIHQLNQLFPGGAPADGFEERSKQIEQLPSQVNVLGAELERVFRERDAVSGETKLLLQLYNYYFA